MGIFGTAFAQAQKLFDRGLALVGLLPCVAFAAVLLALTYGGGAVSILARNFGPRNADSPILIFLAVLGLSLAAYLLYGLRGLLYSLHCGGWDRMLGRRSLARRLIAQQKARRRLVAAYQLQDSPLETAYWAGAGDAALKFLPIWTPAALPFADLRAALARFEWLHDVVHPALERRDGLSVTETLKLWEMLSCAARAHGQLRFLRDPSADPATQAERDELARGVEKAVRYVKEDAARFPAFAPCVEDMAAVYFGERDLYFESLTAVFPHRRSGEIAARVRPTRLGNAALRAELYALDRYGIALDDLWPRLELALTDEAKKPIDDSRQLLDFAVVMTALSGLAALFQVCHLLEFAGRALRLGGHPPPVSPWHWLLALAGLGGCLLAVTAFDEVAVQAARGYGARLCAVIDLHRLDLLQALSIPAPQTRSEETILWKRLSAFIRDARAMDGIGYRAEPAEAAPARRGKKPARKEEEQEEEAKDGGTKDEDAKPRDEAAEPATPDSSDDAEPETPDGPGELETPENAGGGGETGDGPDL
jgi:hypothetical protein